MAPSERPDGATSTADARFTRFVRTRGRALSRTATLIAGDVDLGEDLLQTALATAYLSLAGLSDDAQLEAAVRASMVAANTGWRRRRARTERPLDERQDAAHTDDWAAIADRVELLAALRRLPARQRTVLVLRYYEDRSEAETAALLGCSIGAVQQQAWRARTRLLELLPPRRETPVAAPVHPGRR